MSLQKQKMCEGCGLPVPHFGLASEGKRRWCSGCAKGHAGAVNIINKKCEGGKHIHVCNKNTCYGRTRR